MSSKLVVEVVGVDQNGQRSTQIIKLPSQHDWKANSAALMKKIAKKFRANDGSYKLQISDVMLDPADADSLAQAVSKLDLSSTTPQFKICENSTKGEPDGKQIVVHFEQQKPFTFAVDDDLSQLDDAVFSSLVDGARAHFQVQGQLGKLYEDVRGKRMYIDDWDDLSECLEELECGQSLQLHVEPTVASKPSKRRNRLKATNDDENDDDDEKKEALPAPPKTIYRGPKKKVSLVFVGETGVGKTTLLTSIQDFINRVPFDKVRCTKKPELVGLSQTQDTRNFPLSNDEWAVNIIDTPGIGDTSGAARDQEHMGSIIDFLGDYGDFNAVCILIKRGTTRLSTRMRYIVNELRSNMPKDVKNNFIVIMTRSDVPVPDKDTMAVIKQLHLPTGNIIPVNNNAYEELDLKQYPPGSPILKIVKTRQRDDYKSNHDYLQILLEAAVEMKPYQGDKMRQLKIKRDKLKEQVGLLKRTIDDSFETEKEIKEKLAALEAAKTVEQMNKAFDQSGEHTDYEYVKVHGKISTACNACKQVCHIDCGLSYGDELNGCACASGSSCNRCGCSMSSHAHLGWKRREKKVWVSNVNEDMKFKFMNAQQQQRELARRKDDLKKKLTTLEQKRDQCAKDIRQKYSELEHIAIIGYNESFEQYMMECKKAVEKDDGLTRQEKEEKISVFDTALHQFNLFKDAVKGKLKQAKDYVGSFASTN
eukprot:CAMPEP_0197024238 /NCGR_PEP_ID=MMETSP1384-20130603/4838_1 /TAXON_ID=29189 /ORGANISM="Ammonia sp." /LENGTH=703 /DNA_ID=CAMNT_0042452591 /DNA_START=38 /DNA_END=2149 /DNA_ORIENTATION=+